MLNEKVLNQIKSEVRKYINIEDQEALTNKVIERVEEWEKDNLDADIIAITYELANDFDEWYQ